MAPIRRSMTKLLGDRLPKTDWAEVEMLPGHPRFDGASDIHAPFDPCRVAAAKAEIGRILDGIIAAAPRAFHREATGGGAEIVIFGSEASGEMGQRKGPETKWLSGPFHGGRGKD